MRLPTRSFLLLLACTTFASATGPVVAEGSFTFEVVGNGHQSRSTSRAYLIQFGNEVALVETRSGPIAQVRAFSFRGLGGQKAYGKSSRTLTYLEGRLPRVGSDDGDIANVQVRIDERTEKPRLTKISAQIIALDNGPWFPTDIEFPMPTIPPPSMTLTFRFDGLPKAKLSEAIATATTLDEAILLLGKKVTGSETVLLSDYKWAAP